MASGTDKGNKFRPIGVQIDPLRSPTEGHDAHGRPSQIVKDEFPTRIEEVNDFLYYLGWAELGEAEDEPYWKIRRIRKIGDVWYQEYAFGNQFYRYKWTERASLPYA
jgi:hypothetical protein